MKRLLVYAIAVIVSSQCLWAGSDGMKVSVHVDGSCLEDLLTDEQKAGVTNLKITGSLAEEDYAYLRNSLFLQLDTLDLLDADIDTIPSNVFNWNRTGVYTADFRVILPKALRHLADYSLNMGDASIVFELTGPFPTLGKYVYGEPLGSRSRIEPSADNVAYKMTRNYMYSTDGSVLYFADAKYLDDAPPYGVRTIWSNAFECCGIGGVFILPASVDSIGDRAFADVTMLYITGRHDHPDPVLGFASTTPPRLGRGVFDKYDDSGIDLIFVPEESMELYRQTEGWKDLCLSSLDYVLDIDRVASDAAEGIDVADGGEAYTLQSVKPISRVVCYSVGGQMLRDVPVMAETVVIAKSEIPGPYMLVRIYFDDGTGQVVKLSR